jgi:hypothetical protein
MTATTQNLVHILPILILTDSFWTSDFGVWQNEGNRKHVYITVILWITNYLEMMHVKPEKWLEPHFQIVAILYFRNAYALK